MRCVEFAVFGKGGFGMREQVEERLSSLQAEFKAGQEILTDLETRETNVRNTLVRISGAIQVLEELLNQEVSPRFSAETASATNSAATA
jgi:septation ring formation regulator EzrA